MGWYLRVLKRYADFRGRSRRRELWIFLLLSAFLSFVLSSIDMLLGAGSNTGYGLLSGIYWLAILLPTLAVMVRRFHDTGRSGAWLLLLLIPIFGWFALLAFWTADGEPGVNRFGPDPSASGSG